MELRRKCQHEDDGCHQWGYKFLCAAMLAPHHS
jgi:hypothetical protein